MEEYIFDAIRSGNLEEVKRMVNENHEIVNILEGFSKWTPLDLAVIRGNLEIAKYLWGEGGRPNLNAYCDGDHPLIHYAVQYGHPTTLKWILEKRFLPWDVLNVIDWDGCTPLDNAIVWGKLDLAEFLWEMGGRPNLEIYRDGKWTPVHHAAYGGHSTTLKWIFAKKILPLNIHNAKGRNEWTPLDCAIHGGKWKTITLFRRLIHLDPVLLAMQRAKRDYHQMCVLRRLPDELLDMVVDEVAQRVHLIVVWH